MPRVRTASDLVVFPSPGGLVAAEGLQFGCLPDLVASPTATTSAANTWSPYVELVAAGSITQDIAIYLVSADPNAYTAWLEIATGASGAEQPLCQVALRGYTDHRSDQANIYPPAIVRAGARIAFRIASAYGAGTWPLTGVNYVKLPLPSGQTVTPSTKLNTVRPLLAAPVNVVNGAGTWLYGAWTEIWPAGTFSTPVVVTQIMSMSNNTEGQLQLGSGAAGSEIPFITVRASAAYELSGMGIVPPALPVVASGARVAARLASVDLNNRSWNIAVSAMPTPLV